MNKNYRPSFVVVFPDREMAALFKDWRPKHIATMVKKDKHIIYFGNRGAK